jgi:hypothetical protein
MNNILEGDVFRVGLFEDISDTHVRWTWEMKYRKQFLYSAKLLKTLYGLKFFVNDETTKLRSSECLQFLRICAIIVDCSYVVFCDGVGYFVRNLRLSDGICPCGKIGNLRCGRCKKNYCSVACQREDWKEHKFFCS